jgi:hypothetical protein
MEKLVYLLWKKTDTLDWEQTLKTDVVASCRQAGANHLRLNLTDEDIAPANVMRMTPEPALPDAMLSLWLNSASQRGPIETILRENSSTLAGYLVTESEPLPNTQYPATSGHRTHGMNHVVFLKIPSRLTREQWLELWLNHHTPVAIDTQDTFGYRQNIITRRLTVDAPAIDAIVEENFQPEAMTDQNAFYKRMSKEELKKNQKLMFESCSKFIDFDQLGRLPTSEYNFL